MALFYSLFATIVISLISFVGVLFLSTRRAFLNRFVVLLISLAAGTMMGGAFLHLLPEASEVLDGAQLFGYVLVAFILFYVVERVLHWRHCHHNDCKVHNNSLGYMNIIGDGIHNFMDGMVVAAAFMTDFNLGLATTLAIVMHEIPQEIGDFGVLMHSGFSKRKALALNFGSALLAVGGAVFSYVAAQQVENLQLYLLPLAAGGFIYIAASDLLPEIRKEENLAKAIVSFFIFLLGVGIMYYLTLFE